MDTPSADTKYLQISQDVERIRSAVLGNRAIFGPKPGTPGVPYAQRRRLALACKAEPCRESCPRAWLAWRNGEGFAQLTEAVTSVSLA